MKVNGDRALADILGGSRAGWYFWTAMLAKLEEAIAWSREREGSFCSHPMGELRRMMRDVDDALELAATAVAVQDLVNGDDVDHASIEDVLRARVAELVAERERA